jgi:alkylation response protein AidB-like acyl-CoA dehydrogenase
VPAENVIGKPGFALSHLAPVGLQWGRLSTACSALGLLRGCLAESSGRAAARRVGERSVGSFGMVQSLLAGMGADHEAAMLLCWSACRAEDERRPDSFRRAFLAKYFSAQAAVRAAGNAVQIHGASGCHESSPVARYYRNAKIMEIIEGTTQVHEAILGRALVEEAAALRRRPRDD